MYQIIRYIGQLGDTVWCVVAESSNEADADYARDFFEANWPWEDTGIDGRIYYSYKVRKI